MGEEPALPLQLTPFATSGPWTRSVPSGLSTLMCFTGALLPAYAPLGEYCRNTPGLSPATAGNVSLSCWVGLKLVVTGVPEAGLFTTASRRNVAVTDAV